jgi:hypothetical protein
MPTLVSIIAAQEVAWSMGIRIESNPLGGDADIAHARNVLLGDFLRGDCTDLFFLDADISFSADDFARLLAHNVPFVCGCYRLRTDTVEHYPVFWPEQKRMWKDPATGLPLVEAEMVAGGFWLIKREAIEQMAAATPDEAWVRDPDYPFIFDWQWEDGKRRSEDFTFCRKWRKLGGEIWVDPAIKLDHTGMKVFEGNLLASLAQETRKHQASGGVLDRAKRFIADDAA